MASVGVLNPSGIRFGSAEIYSVSETFHQIEDAIRIGQQRKVDANESVILFLKLRDGINFTQDLAILGYVASEIGVADLTLSKRRGFFGAPRLW